MKTNLLHHVCSGRRGTKRKAEVQVEEEKPSVEEEVEKGEEENGQQGQRVVIEHWWATSWLNTFACLLLIIHFNEAFNTFKMFSTVKVFKSIPSFSAFTECIDIPVVDFTFEPHDLLVQRSVFSFEQGLFIWDFHNIKKANIIQTVNNPMSPPRIHPPDQYRYIKDSHIM